MGHCPSKASHKSSELPSFLTATSPSVTRQSVVNQIDVLLRIAEYVSLTEAKDKNLVFSPLLIYLALSVIAAGSDGPTREQVLRFLKSSSIDELNKLLSEQTRGVLSHGSRSGGPKLAFVNAVWIDQSLTLKHQFNRILESVYKATSAQADFMHKPGEAVEKVNSWVEKSTNGLIKELLPSGSVDKTTKLIFTNGLYFKGVWQQKFDASLTHHSDFYLLNKTSIKVPMMRSSVKQFISTYDGFKVLRLPYRQGSNDKRQFSLYIYLPEVRDELPLVVEKINSKSGFVDQHIPRDQVTVGDFRIPKFKISFGFESSSVLKQLGVVLPFSSGGFTEMVNTAMDKKLCVSKIFHKAFIEVNEEGTEAAAATSVVLLLRSISMITEVDFVADHPFLFLIREDLNGVVLFVGNVLNPSLPTQ